MGERRVPTVDELFATLKNSSMPTVIVEGRDDIVFYRKVEDELSDLGIDILSAGNKDKVLELREKILSENLSIPIAFIVDKDLWVNYGVPTEYQDSLITTNGYSIENDLFLDGDLLLLLDSDELLDFKDDLDVFIKWYALAINRHVNDKKTIYDEISSFRYHPNKLLDDKSFYIKETTLKKNEIYPEELYESISLDYANKLRGKSLLGLLLRYLSKKERKIKCSPRSAQAHWNHHGWERSLGQKTDATSCLWPQGWHGGSARSNHRSQGDGSASPNGLCFLNGKLDASSTGSELYHESSS